MADVHLVGVNHFLQDVVRQLATAEGEASEQQQKDEFVAHLNRLDEHAHFDLVAEEAKLDAESFAFQGIKDWGARYCNVTMPLLERERRGLVNYEKDAALRIRAMEQFEGHMFARIQAERADAARILVICGWDHLEGLSKMFREYGDQVTTQDVREASWFKGFAVERANANGFCFLGNARDDNEMLNLMMNSD